MPIVEEPFTFREIAVTNAIRDIFGWPINKLPAQGARKVLAGGHKVFSRVGSPLVGGYCIDSLEPILKIVCVRD